MTACNFTGLLESPGIELPSFCGVFFFFSTPLLVRNLICELCSLGAPARPTNTSPIFPSVQLLTKVQFVGGEK